METLDLSEEEINKIINNVKATMEIEDLAMTKEAEELGRKLLKKKLTADESVDLIKSKYTL